ncbi:MAG: 1,4-dihydroxy-2-naphthoate polyprenyltransferase, partial [Microthrixaceae bacterium]
PADLPEWRIWLLGIRPRTLPAAVAPVFVGTAGAVGAAGSGAGPGGIIWWRFAAAMVVALSVQIATNLANDYSDGRRGTDDPGERVGPPRLVGGGLVPAARVRSAMLGCFAVTLLAGTPLVLVVDWRLAIVGAAAVAAGWFYTGGPRPYGYAGFGEVFVFVFFGLVATMGSAYVQTRQLPAATWLAAVAMGLLATAMLVANNLRDIPGDVRAGKRTLAVRLGDAGTRVLYVALVGASVVSVPGLVALGASPVVALALVSVVLARRPVIAVLSGARGAALIPVLASTGVVQVVFAAGITVGLVLP